jgi:hypothetical protein
VRRLDVVGFASPTMTIGSAASLVREEALRKATGTVVTPTSGFAEIKRDLDLKRLRFVLLPV